MRNCADVSSGPAMWSRTGWERLSDDGFGIGAPAPTAAIKWTSAASACIIMALLPCPRGCDAGPMPESGHHDFFAFYSAGRLIREGQPQSLYDASTLTALERHIWPHPTGYAGYMPFLNPPSAAVILSPLALLPFATARLLWLAISIALAIACAVVLTSGRDLRTRGLAVVAVLATFPAYQTFTEGQWSFVILLGALGALVMARRHLDWLAGALLLSLWLKPP